MNGLRLLLTLACCLMYSVPAFAQGRTPKPLDQLSAAEKETYAKLLQEYRSAETKRDRLLEEAKKADPAFDRAAYWLEHEQPKANTQFRQLEKEFLSTNLDKKMKYRQWKKWYSQAVRDGILDKEWKNVPSAQPALLFIADKMMEMEKKKAKDRSTNDDAQIATDAEIPELKGSDNEKWEQFRAYCSKQYGDPSNGRDTDALERELRIPTELKNELRKEASPLFVPYDTYYRFHLPPEVKAIQRQKITTINELNKLRPGWEIAEGIESPADKRKPGGRGAYQAEEKGRDKSN